MSRHHLRGSSFALAERCDARNCDRVHVNVLTDGELDARDRRVIAAALAHAYDDGFRLVADVDRVLDDAHEVDR